MTFVGTTTTTTTPPLSGKIPNGNGANKLPSKESVEIFHDKVQDNALQNDSAFPHPTSSDGNSKTLGKELKLVSGHKMKFKNGQFQEGSDPTKGNEDTSVPNQPHKEAFMDSYLEFNCNDLKQLKNANTSSSSSAKKPGSQKKELFAIPRFNKTIQKDIGITRPMTTSALEVQLRNAQNIMGTDFRDLYSQVSHPRCETREDYEERRYKYAEMEMELWKLQHRLNVHRGTVPRCFGHKEKAYEDLLKHMEVLNKGNLGNVLQFTTDRYGETDMYNSLKKNSTKIMKLFETRMDK